MMKYSSEKQAEKNILSMQRSKGKDDNMLPPETREASKEMTNNLEF